MKIHVLLADDRKMVREGLSLLLERHNDIRVAGEADQAQSALKLVRALSPDVMVFNLALTNRAAVEFIRSARQACAETRVLVLTLWPTPTFIRDVLEAGAAGCLTRECASVDLVTAIRTVMTHRIYLSPQITEAVVSGYVLSGEKHKHAKRLSARERQILQHIADGETTKQIAAIFHVSTKTIETHRRRIMEKLGRHSVAELTKYALREGLTSMEYQS